MYIIFGLLCLLSGAIAFIGSRQTIRPCQLILGSHMDRLEATRLRPLFGRKIDDEAAAMNSSGGQGSKRRRGGKKGKKNDNNKGATIVAAKAGADTGAIIEDQEAMVSIAGTPVADTSLPKLEEPAVTGGDIFPAKPGYSKEPSVSATDIDPTVSAQENASNDQENSNDTPKSTVSISSTGNSKTIGDTIKVPKQNPLQQAQIPPEVVFFGEPRNPPPGELGRDVKYHGSLLYWARHATVAPRTSQEREELVFPRGRLHPDSPRYRLDALNLSYQTILDKFIAVMDDLEATKSFIDSNIDLVPSKLFLRVLTADKLTAQSRNDLEKMDFLKDVRRKYILAHDQVFFPLNIEIQKAETRVMTYLARPELKQFAQDWDDIEMTLHFTTLLAARLTWDQRVKDILDDIRERVDSSVGYMQEGLERDLMSREFRKPGLTAELYLNASNIIESGMPELYSKVKPEVQLLHETYFMDSDELKTYVNKIFCPRTNMGLDQLKEKLRIYESSLAAAQGVDYVNLRLFVQSIHRALCTEKEELEVDRWYFDYVSDGYKFETYEPDEVPTLIKFEQRLRDTGNAFSNFAVEVLKAPTKFTEAFSGARPKASQVGDWLKNDPDWTTPQPAAYEERVEKFREAYISLTEERKAAESKLTDLVRNRMDAQDRLIYGPGLVALKDGEESSVINFDGEQ